MKKIASITTILSITKTATPKETITDCKTITKSQMLCIIPHCNVLRSLENRLRSFPMGVTSKKRLTGAAITRSIRLSCTVYIVLTVAH